MSAIRFDSAIDTAIEAVRRELGNRRLPITLVREVTGQIIVVVDDDDMLSSSALETLATALNERLGRYSSGPRQVVLRRSDLIDPQDILESPDRVQLLDHEDVWLVDRLLTNQEWLRAPRIGRLRIPVGTAFSLKGGVGRSTAVAVWAWYLARLGHRVVAVDLDLEAPGLDSLLVGELPTYGMVDWLVESLLAAPDAELLDDCLAFSPVADDSEGVVQVLPAFGARTRDYVAKLGRAYLPQLDPDGVEVGLSERISSLVQALADRPDPPDVVLLDSRAGLHDIGAALVTQLGAEVFLFARDELQSWRAYKRLFEHLSRSKGLHFGMPDDDLRWRLKMVAAQVDPSDGAVASWLDSSYDTWSALYDDEGKEAEEISAQTFGRDDPSAPHFPLTCFYNDRLRGLGLADAAQRPPWSVVEAAFGDFLEGATARLLSAGPASGTEVREGE